MANVMKKLRISSNITQKKEEEAMAKESELGITENIEILDDGDNLKTYSRKMEPRSNASR